MALGTTLEERWFRYSGTIQFSKKKKWRRTWTTWSAQSVMDETEKVLHQAGDESSVGYSCLRCTAALLGARRDARGQCRALDNLIFHIGLTMTQPKPRVSPLPHTWVLKAAIEISSTSKMFSPEELWRRGSIRWTCYPFPSSKNGDRKK